MNPFLETKDPTDSDESLILQIQSGDKAALEKLVLRHQAWIYNIILRMVYQPHDAEDATQEVLVKVITKLDSFKGRSAFRTWIYRIALNHILNVKKIPAEKMVSTFSQYGDELDMIPDQDPSDLGMNKAEFMLLVEEARVSCIHGMLLCLEREQRLIFVLGDILNVHSQMGAKLMDMSADNFRQRLTRARKDLFTFMDQKCGLVNKNNACRCAKKTKGFIKAGIVNPDSLTFHSEYINKITELTPVAAEEVDNLEDSVYSSEYKNTPFIQNDAFIDGLKEMLTQSVLNKNSH